MKGVTITANDKVMKSMTIDLKDLLALIPESRSSQWRMRNVEAVGKYAATLHRHSDNQEQISGEEFLSVSLKIDQTIDGVFEAYKSNCFEPWLRIRAVDGIAFDVETEDESILNRIRQSFKSVADLP